MEHLGVERILVKSDDSHSFFGILDRRIQLIRFLYPKIHEELTSEFLDVESEDIAAEVELATNTGLSYGGFTPYNCLFGAHP